ncbi:MAG: hypothetical protein ACFN9G_01375 [Cardiobacterium sp.]
MNHDKMKKSESTPSDGFLGWLYDLLFSRKNAGVDETPTSPARETIPEHDSGRAEKLFAQMQQENEAVTPRTAQAASATSTRTAHQDASESGSHHHATSASHDDGGSSSSCDSDSGSSGCD